MANDATSIEEEEQQAEDVNSATVVVGFSWDVIYIISLILLAPIALN